MDARLFGERSLISKTHTLQYSPRPTLYSDFKPLLVCSPEMYELSENPSKPVVGNLRQGLRGIVGASTRTGQTVSLFPGALQAMQELFLHPDWEGTKVAAASSSEVPQYSATCLDTLEILPGVKMRQVFSYLAIGRTGELSSDKRTHFKKIQPESGVAFEGMLFFDDCNWGNHVKKIRSAFGVVGVATPNGMQYDEWRKGLEIFAGESESEI